MLNTETNSLRNPQSGSAAIIVLAAIVVLAAIGAGAYFSGALSPKAAEDNPAVLAESEPAAAPEEVEVAEQASEEAAPEVEPIELKEGNPVVAKVGDKEVKRNDVLAFMQSLSPQMKQMPIQQLFPLAQEQTINAILIEQKVNKADLSNDPLVKKELEVAKKQIVRSVFMQKEAEKALTDDVLKAAYEDYKKNFPEIEEIKARHILVEDEKLAKDLIKQIKDGGDFAVLATENSIDATKANGGELNYFAKTDVVPEFGDAVFAMDVGELTKKPVKSEFGYHVIEVMDKRMREPLSFEQAKPLLAAQLRGQAVNMVVQKWRQEADVELFDINGEPVKKAQAPAAPAEESAPVAE